MDGYELVNGPDGLALVLRGPWRPELREVIRNTAVRHLRLSAYLGFRQDRIDFLAQALLQAIDAGPDVR